MTRIPLEFPLPEAAFERQRSVLAEHLAGRRATRLARTRLVALAAAALVAALGAASAFGTVRGLLPVVGREPPSTPWFNRWSICTGAHGSFTLRISVPWTDRLGAWKLATGEEDPSGFFKPGTGQYAGVTGGGRWRGDLITRAGSKLRIKKLWGTIASGGQKQRVLITLEAGGMYTAPGRVNPRTFVLRPLERGPLKADSGTQHTFGAG
jgi:hypothetical protein